MAIPFPKSIPRINLMSLAMVTKCEQEDRLLPHQIEALQSLCDWFGGPQAHNIALVCMPTGSGKTGIIACLPYYLASIRSDGQRSTQETDEPRYRFDKPVLVVAPDLTIRNQLVDELTVLSPSGAEPNPFLKRIGIVPSDELHTVLPKAIMIESTAELKNQQHLKSNDMVITNVQKFCGKDWNDLDSTLFRLVIVDEAHHHPATTWRQIINKFRNPECPVVFLTATPFRTDGQPVLGPQENGIAYRLSLNDAVERRIIRESHFEELDEVGVAKFRNPDGYTEDARQNAGNMVAILAKVKELLDHKREAFGKIPHNMAVAICKDTEQADLLLELWQHSYPNESAECYYSRKEEKEKDLIMEKLRNNQLSLVIIVAMLLEGFDHPPISIAAITYEIKSPVRFVQFVGRAQRIYRQQGYNEPLAVGAHIVTHVDYNQGSNYKNFISEALITNDAND